MIICQKYLSSEVALLGVDFKQITEVKPQITDQTLERHLKRVSSLSIKPMLMAFGHTTINQRRVIKEIKTSLKPVIGNLLSRLSKM